MGVKSMECGMNKCYTRGSGSAKIEYAFGSHDWSGSSIG